jgi:hypothetical protein
VGRSLTRGRVCHLQLLLALASAAILRSESHGTRDHTRILLYQVRDFPFRRLLRLAGLRWRYSSPPPHVIRISEETLTTELTSIRTEYSRSPSQRVPLLSVAAETSEPLSSKLTSASAAIPAFRQCLPSRQLLRTEGVAWSAQRIRTAVNLGFLNRHRYFSIQVAPQLSSRG